MLSLCIGKQSTLLMDHGIFLLNMNVLCGEHGDASPKNLFQRGVGLPIKACLDVGNMIR